MNTTIREIAASIIERANQDPNYSADDLTYDIFKAVAATRREAVTYVKVRDFVSAVNDAIAIADGITLNPRYDSIRIAHLNPATHGKNNTSVYFQLAPGVSGNGTIADALMFDYTTPKAAIIRFAHMFARVMGVQFVDSSDFAPRFYDYLFDVVW